jgi:hypothetical protein
MLRISLAGPVQGGMEHGAEGREPGNYWVEFSVLLKQSTAAKPVQT